MSGALFGHQQGDSSDVTVRFDIYLTLFLIIRIYK